MAESDRYIEETIGLIPKTGCSRQVRILPNAFFIRPRLKTLSSYGLMYVAFSMQNQHLLSFYELSNRLVSRKIGIEDLLVLMQALRDVRETRKIRDMYWLASEEFNRQLETGDSAMIVEGISAFDKGFGLSRRTIAQIKEAIAVRCDGTEVGERLASVIRSIDLDRVARARQAKEIN